MNPIRRSMNRTARTSLGHPTRLLLARARSNKSLGIGSRKLLAQSIRERRTKFLRSVNRRF